MQHILVAHGERRARQATARAARDAYPQARVIEAHDGGQALAILEAAGYRFDLVVLAADMPRASGLFVLGAIASVRPEVPVLVLGDADHADLALDLGAAGFLGQADAPALVRA